MHMCSADVQAGDQVIQHDLGQHDLAIFLMVPQLPSKGFIFLEMAEFKNQVEVSKDSTLGLERAHHQFCHIVLAQTRPKTSRVSSIGEIDFLMGGLTKPCCKECRFRERKNSGRFYNQPAAHLLSRCNSSEIGIELNAVLECLQSISIKVFRDNLIVSGSHPEHDQRKATFN